MTQYVFTMTSRMVTIAALCVVLLCILLFLMGIEIGKQWGNTVPAPALPAASAAPAAAPTEAPVAPPKAQTPTS